MFGITTLLPLIFLLGLSIPVVMGIYVYKDAKRRNMNAALWALISILAPGFVGLIIYLIVRAEHSGLSCGNCGKPVQERFISCPYCGNALKERCHNCECPLEAGWEKCPNCGTDIPAEQREKTLVMHENDKSLWKVLLILIAVPILLCAMIALFARLYAFDDGKRVVSMTDVQIEAVIEANTSAGDWLDACSKSPDGVYVLRFKCYAEGESAGYLIYRNDGYATEAASNRACTPSSVTART